MRRDRIVNGLLWIVAPAAVVVFASATQSVGCTDTASDCAALGLPAGCKTGGSGGGDAGTDAGDAGMGGAGTGGAGTGGAGTGGAGTGGAGTGGAGGATTSSTGSTTSSTGTGGMAVAEPAVCAAKRFGDAQDQTAKALVVDPMSHDVLIGGGFQGKPDLGKGPLAAGTMFVASYTQSLAAVWTTPEGATLQSMAVDAQGNVFLAGTYAAAVNFGCGALDPAMGSFYLVKLTVSGGCAFSQSFAATVVRSSLAVDPQGDVILAGAATGTVNFTAPQVSHGGEDILLVKFGATGAATSSRLFGDTLDDGATGVAVDASGKVFVTGTFDGNFDFGGAVVDSTAPSPHVGVFVAGFDDSLSTLWATSFAGDGDAGAASVVALGGAAGGFAVAGGFTGNLDLGGGHKLTAPGGGFFVARLSTDGTTTTSVAPLLGAAAPTVTAMTAGPSGDLALAGSLGADAYVAYVDDLGVIRLQQTLGGTGVQRRATGVGFQGTASSVSLVVGGYFDGTLDAGKSPVDGGAEVSLTSAGGDDIFMLQLCPFSP